MDENYWLEKWRKLDVKFDQSNVNPWLLKYKEVFGDLTNRNILVPLCGKSIDMTWFHQQGAQVIGVELSSRATQAFFDDSKLSYKKISQPPFQLYQHDGIKIICGDFFSLEKKHVGEIDIVYDRGALIALPDDKRKEYVKKMTALLKPDCKIFLITLEYHIDSPPERPPFSVTPEEIDNLYANNFEIKLVNQEELTSIAPHLKKRGISVIQHRVYFMVKK